MGAHYLFIYYIIILVFSSGLDFMYCLILDFSCGLSLYYHPITKIREIKIIILGGLADIIVIVKDCELVKSASGIGLGVSLAYSGQRKFKCPNFPHGKQI